LYSGHVTPAASDASRRIVAERIVLLAWPRAILLQLAHPLIAAGVAAHSSFRGSSVAAFSRLHHTVHAMLAITFGSDEECERALDGIRAIHRRVNGPLGSTTGPYLAGTRYSAEDPELLLWVHATLVESMALAYDQLVAPLGDGDRDRYCADSAEVAEALGAHPDALPRTWRGLRAYLDAQYASGRIAVGHEAHTLAASLLSPVGGPIGRAIVTPLVSLLAVGSLPPAIRQQYGFAWSAGRQRRFDTVMSVVRRIRSVLPGSLATWRISRDVRKRTAMRKGAAHG
jgi:uncharacterized protein (DUF2236 family)